MLDVGGADVNGSYRELFLSAQRRAKTNEPIPDDIFPIGTLASIIQLLRLPDGTVKVLVEAKRRAQIRRFVQTDGFFLVEVDELPDVPDRSVELEAIVREVHATFEAYVKLNKRLAPEILVSVQTIDDFVPRDQDAKARALGDVRRLLPERILARLPGADQPR